MILQFGAEQVTTSDSLTAVDVVLRITMAAGLGTIVAILFTISRNPEERRRGFSQTLVLLAPLIAMVTMAVGQNIAAAFTLVGTLAIVRFRTTVSDTRDTAYVIFSVAAGLATGTFSVLVATLGTGLIGAVILLIRLIEGSRPAETGATASLRVLLSPPDCNPSVLAPVISRFAAKSALKRSSVDRRTKELELRLSIAGLDPARCSELLAALYEIPEVLRVSLSLDTEALWQSLDG